MARATSNLFCLLGAAVLSVAILAPLDLTPSLAVRPAQAAAQTKIGEAKTHDRRASETKTDDATPATAPASGAAPPYEPQLLRLSELLGALSYLGDLCGPHQGDVWRARMSALLNAEAKTQLRKERLAGAFNRGFNGYALTYRQCTPNARAIISRFLTESSEIARDVARRYGPS